MRKLALLSSFLFTTYACAATPSVNDVLVNVKNCSKTIVLRHQALSKKQENAACKMLSAQEARFHSV
ncbi:MAG: collagenase, partial [Pseudoalteromonas spongiae]